MPPAASRTQRVAAHTQENVELLPQKRSSKDVCSARDLTADAIHWARLFPQDRAMKDDAIWRFEHSPG